MGGNDDVLPNPLNYEFGEPCHLTDYTWNQFDRNMRVIGNGISPQSLAEANSVEPLDSHKARQARLVSDKPAKPHIPRFGSECFVFLLGLSGSVDLVGIDDDRHSVEPHDFPDPWVRKRHGLVSQPPLLPPLAPLRRV